MTRVLLATSRDWPSGEPGHEALDRELAARDIDARWVIWNDPAVAWEDAALVAVRSPWDYMDRLPEFLAWSARVEGLGVPVLHGSTVFAWNTDKTYLLELSAAGVPTVPTLVASTEAEARTAVAAPGGWMVKPPVGAGGVGATAVRAGTTWVPATTGPWLVQPLVESVRTEGETSVFIIDGAVVSQLRKTPAGDEFRVNELYGGTVAPVPQTAEARDLALQAYAATEAILATTLSYARIDLLRHHGQLLVTEVEITEPGLYLDVLPANAVPFVDMLERRLGRP